MSVQNTIDRFTVEVSHELGLNGVITDKVRNEVRRRLKTMGKAIKTLSAITWYDLLHIIEGMSFEEQNKPIFVLADNSLVPVIRMTTSLGYSGAEYKLQSGEYFLEGKW